MRLVEYQKGLTKSNVLFITHYSIKSDKIIVAQYLGGVTLLGSSAGESKKGLKSIRLSPLFMLDKSTIVFAIIINLTLNHPCRIVFNKLPVTMKMEGHNEYKTHIKT